MKKTVSFSKKARNIFFHILTDCNLTCRHCYINKKQHGTNRLTIDTISAWLAIFAKEGKENNLILLGGEPTLHSDLNLAVQEAKRLNYNSITIDTNGYLFFNILSKLTPDEVDYFSFSLDGSTPQLNDEIRGKGSYNNCIDGIKRAAAAGFNTSMIYTASSYNINDLQEMPNLLEQIKPDKFFIQTIGLRGKSSNYKSKNAQVQREEWLDIVPKTAKKIADLGINVIYPKVYLNENEVFDCAGLAANNYFIFPNGRVYRCPLCEDFPINSMVIEDKNHLTKNSKINEADLFNLSIPEGCVLNKIVQPNNIEYGKDGKPLYKIACCMLKEEIQGR